MLQSKKSAVVVLNFAMVLFGLSGVIGQAVSADSVTVVAMRVLFSSVILGTFLKVRKSAMLPNCWKHVVIAVLAGALQGFSWVAFFTSIKVTSVAIAMITFATAPLFVSVIEPVVFREKFQWKSFGFALVALVGVLIATPEFSMENSVTVGIIWGMISSFTYAVLTLMNRTLSVDYTGAQVCFWEHFIAMCVTMPIALAGGLVLSATDVGLLAVMGVLCTSIAFSLLVQTQKILPAQLVALMAGAETVYGIALAYLLLQEVPTAQQLVGGAVILVAIMTAAWKTQIQKEGAV